MITYSPLCELRIEHAFYRTGISPDLVLVPTAATTRLFRDYQMRMREKEGGWQIYYRHSELPGQSVTDLLSQPNARLSFRLELRNPYFSQFTALPTASDGQLLGEQQYAFYYNNQHPIDENGQVYLSGQPAPAGPSDWIQPPITDGTAHTGAGDAYLRFSAIPTWPKLTQPQQADQPTEYKLTLKNPDGSPLADSPTATLSWDHLQRQWRMIDIAHTENLAVGPYLAEIDAHPTVRVFYTPVMDHQPPAFGQLELWLGPDANGQPRFTVAADNPQQVVPPTYYIRFLNRQVVFRYIIIQRSSDDRIPTSSAFQITTPGGGVAFGQEKEEEAASNELRTYLRSDQLMPLREQIPPDQRPQLTISGTTGNGSQTLQLPYADHRMIRAERTESTDGSPGTLVTYLADMYVYL